MPAAIAAALKKLAVYVGTNKKALKTAVGIVLGVVVILIMPIAVILGMFTGEVDLKFDRLEELIAEQQERGNIVMAEIEEVMLAAGRSELQVKEAQALYLFALFEFGEEEGFAEKLAGCFTAEEQTDEELISAVNEAFGTSIRAKDFAELVGELREEFEQNDKTEERQSG